MNRLTKERARKINRKEKLRRRSNEKFFDSKNVFWFYEVVEWMSYRAVYFCRASIRFSEKEALL